MVGGMGQSVWIGTFRKYPYVWTFVLLLLTVMALPLVSEFSNVAARLGNLVLYAFTLTLGVVAAEGTRRALSWVTSLCLGVVLVAMLAELLLFGHSVQPYAFLCVLVVWVAATVMTLFIVLHHLLVIREIGTNEVFGALTVYMLTGLLWASFYFTLYWFEPASFNFHAEELGTDELDMPSCVYFSFITLTTTGYGDIRPVTSLARGFAVAEALIGVTFMATMVARFVGIASAERSGSK